MSHLKMVFQYASDCPEISRQQWRAWAGQIWQHLQNLLSKDICPKEVWLTLRIVDPYEGQALNRQYRHKDYPTNILTFAYGTDDQGVLVSDLVLCHAVLKREAGEQHKELKAHAVHLLLHGFLHSLGFDHIEDDQAQEMEDLEIKVLALMGYSNPYE